VATLPPRAADVAGSAPVFERKTRTALGLLHIRRYRCDSAPTSFGKLGPVVALWQAKRRGAALPRWKNDSGAVGQILHVFLTPPGVG
jgi:hypothetical protein